jgi:polyhydroxyalkanoate synthesis regulator protein
VLTQIIVEEEARGSTLLPVNFLRQLIALYGNSMQGMVPQYLESAMDSFAKNQTAFRETFGANIFADIAKRNMSLFEEFTKATGGKRQEPAAGKADSSEVDALRAELDALRAKVDKLGQ